MTSPFQQGSRQAPSITPATMKAAGQGGQANPGYLQMRTPTAPGQSRPVVTPQAGVQGDTMAPKPPTPVMPQSPATPPITPMGQQAASPSLPTTSGQPSVTPAGTNPPQRGGQTLGDVYNFMKSDLQNQTKQAKSGAIADASARGVYYGTPLTGSEADIDTQYLRGLGQLDAGMYGNEQQNQLARLGMATNLSAQSAINAPGAPPPMDWSGLGALFGSGSPSNPTAPAVAAPRQGPTITPNQKPARPPYDPAGLSL